MPEKRLYSRRHIKILALQRCSRAISMALREGLFIDRDFPTHGESYPYGVELDLECSEIAYQLRKRLAALAENEFPDKDYGHLLEDSDQLRLITL